MSESNKAIMLVEDHTAFRQALAWMLEHDSGFHVVGQASTVEEARAFLPEADVAVVDLALPDGEGTTVVRELRQANPGSVSLVLTASVEPEAYARAVEAGAAGIMHKTSSIEEIVDALRRLDSGEMLLSVSEVMEMLDVARTASEQSRQARQYMDQLTKREREVLQALGEGLSSKEIAQRLYISIETERSHMTNILTKFGLHSRMQALVFSIKHGIVKIG